MFPVFPSAFQYFEVVVLGVQAARIKEEVGKQGDPQQSCEGDEHGQGTEGEILFTVFEERVLDGRRETCKIL